jgi:glycerol-3-phosphate acyltransferase PlsX
MTERIALDAMGGDEAPRATLQGALLAVDTSRPSALEPQQILLVGDQQRIEQELGELGGNPGFAIVHASQVVGMEEKPAVALRQKPDSSIAKCIGAVRAGEAGAVVGMGNTGACVGAATIGLGTLEGIRRPGIAVTLDLFGAPITILDMGANVAPKPEHLLQYGYMGTVHARACLATAEPRVGLLNIGEEEGKGTDLLRDAYAQLAASGLRFAGNIEPGDMLRGAADVVVTDGFTGNITLKLMESMASFLFRRFTSELEKHSASWKNEALANLSRQIDYAEYGGALLLGVRGVVVIGHGRSDATAVANACRVAARTLAADVNGQIVSGLAQATGQPAS